MADPEETEEGPVFGAGPMPSPTVEELEAEGRLGSDPNASSSVQEEEVGEFDSGDKIAEYQKGLAEELRTVYPTGYEQPELVLEEEPQVVQASARSSSSTSSKTASKDDS
jgi:hypothetical protein